MIIHFPSATFTVPQDSPAVQVIDTYLNLLHVAAAPVTVGERKQTRFTFSLTYRHHEDALIALQRRLMDLGLSYSLYVDISSN